MASHGATDDVIYFAKIMEGKETLVYLTSEPFSPFSLPSLNICSAPSDYDKVISHYIQQYKYEEALKMLREQAAKIMRSSSKVRHYQHTTSYKTTLVGLKVVTAPSQPCDNFGNRLSIVCHDNR